MYYLYGTWHRPNECLTKIYLHEYQNISRQLLFFCVYLCILLYYIYIFLCVCVDADVLLLLYPNWEKKMLEFCAEWWTGYSDTERLRGGLRLNFTGYNGKYIYSYFALTIFYFLFCLYCICVSIWTETIPLVTVIYRTKTGVAWHAHSHVAATQTPRNVTGLLGSIAFSGFSSGV